MLAEDFRDWGIDLRCPKCKRWCAGQMDEKVGHFIANCMVCRIHLAWGIEQDIEEGKFKGTAVSE
jgi:hypothetical protein